MVDSETESEMELRVEWTYIRMAKPLERGRELGRGLMRMS